MYVAHILSHFFVSKLESVDYMNMVLPLLGAEDGMRTAAASLMHMPLRTPILVMPINPSYKRMYLAPVIRDMSTTHMS